MKNVKVVAASHFTECELDGAETVDRFLSCPVCLGLLRKLICNVRDAPGDPKYRKVRLSDPKIARLGRISTIRHRDRTHVNIF